MYPFVLAKRAAVGERLPAEAAGVGPLARVDADVDLLRASRPEHFAWNKYFVMSTHIQYPANIINATARACVINFSLCLTIFSKTSFLC